MTPLCNDPALFADEALAGFVAAHADVVRAVPGGVVRADSVPDGKVAVVVGGGSGHYPAFYGLVGPGMADGAVVGNVFTSPSTADVVSVCRAADRGAGVILLTGNYAGDVMNFTLGVQRLGDDGIEAHYLVVTDDVASAPAGDEHKRRGIAGDLVVFKVAGAAAEAGYCLSDVDDVVQRANRRTRTLGIAFGGCTLPGDEHPLFDVPPGSIGIGVGIHGEPGIGEEAQMSAADLAQTLVARVLADRPVPPGTEVAAVLNGLGRTKYEELFVLWASIAPLLDSAGLIVVRPEVGELVTSLDMAGCSLTLTELDPELRALWLAGADSPAFRRGPLTALASAAVAPPAADPGAAVSRSAPADPVGSPMAVQLALASLPAIDRAADAVVDHERLLGRIDAVAGDGDHGRGMVRGAMAARQAAHEAVADQMGVGEVLVRAGRAWAGSAGGTSGVLWGAMLEQAGARIVDEPATWSRWERDPVGVVLDAVTSAIDRAQALGGACVGEKTLLDALVPFRDALESGTLRHLDLATAWDESVDAAMQGAIDSRMLVPRRGRARPLADKSMGHPDPGAVSLAVIVAACHGGMGQEVSAFVREVES